MKPSEIQAWLTELAERTGPSTAAGAHRVIYGIMAIAEADGLVRHNPACAPAVKRPQIVTRRVERVWSDEQVWAVIDAHPPHLRLIPVLMAGCGLRIGEALAVAGDDLDLQEHVLHVRRQLKQLGESYVYALPKDNSAQNDKTRIVPLPGWVEAEARLHLAAWPPRMLTLPWEKETGRPETHKILFRWATDDQHVRYRLYSEQIWKPALVAAKIIGPPAKDARGRRRYTTTRGEGPHQARHYYASVMLANGVSVRDLAEYLGHDPAVTLRVYGHLQVGGHEAARRAMDARMYRPRRIASGPRQNRRPPPPGCRLPPILRKIV